MRGNYSLEEFHAEAIWIFLICRIPLDMGRHVEFSVEQRASRASLSTYFHFPCALMFLHTMASYFMIIFSMLTSAEIEKLENTLIFSLGFPLLSCLKTLTNIQCVDYFFKSFSMLTSKIIHASPSLILSCFQFHSSVRCRWLILLVCCIAKKW